MRQPGSTLKPLTYLAALNAGLQPNTLVHGLAPSPCRRSAACAAAISGRRRTTRAAAPAPTTLRRGARILEEPRHRAPARRAASHRRRRHSLTRVCDTRHGGADLRRVRALLSVRARRPAGADRSTSRHSTRRSPTRARGRRRTSIESVEQDGKHALHARGQRAGPDRLGRPRRVLPAQDHAAGRDRSAAPRRRWQRCRPMSPARPAPARTRTTPGSRLHQRDHGRGLGRLRQCRRQTPHARPRPDRRPRRGPDLPADHPGGLGQRYRRRRPGGALAGGAAGQIADAADRPRQRRAVARAAASSRHFRTGGDGPDGRHAVSPCAARDALRACAAARRLSVRRTATRPLRPPRPTTAASMPRASDADASFGEQPPRRRAAAARRLYWRAGAGDRAYPAQIEAARPPRPAHALVATTTPRAHIDAGRVDPDYCWQRRGRISDASTLSCCARARRPGRAHDRPPARGGAGRLKEVTIVPSRGRSGGEIKPKTILFSDHRKTIRGARHRADPLRGLGPRAADAEAAPDPFPGYEEPTSPSR